MRAVVTPPGLGRQVSAVRLAALTGMRFLPSIAWRPHADGRFAPPEAAAVALDDGDDLLARVICGDAGEARDEKRPLSVAQVVRFAAAADRALAPAILDLILTAAATEVVLGEVTAMPAYDAAWLARTLIAAHCGEPAATRGLVEVLIAAWRRVRAEAREAHAASSADSAASEWISAFVQDALNTPEAAAQDQRAFYARAACLDDVVLPPGLRALVALLAQDPDATSAAAIAAWADTLRKAMVILPEWWRLQICQGIERGCHQLDLARRAACVGTQSPGTLFKPVPATFFSQANRVSPTILAAAGPGRLVLAAQPYTCGPGLHVSSEPAYNLRLGLRTDATSGDRAESALKVVFMQTPGLAAARERVSYRKRLDAVLSVEAAVVNTNRAPETLMNCAFWAAGDAPATQECSWGNVLHSGRVSMPLRPFGGAAAGYQVPLPDTPSKLLASGCVAVFVRVETEGVELIQI